MELVNEADRLAARGDWDGAVTRYSELYQKNPENPDYRLKYILARAEAAQIHYARGMEHIANNRHDAALLEFQASLLLDPTLDKAKTELKKTRKIIDSLYYYEKGLEFLKKGDEKEARAAFKKSLSANPGNTAAAEELKKLKKPQKVLLDGYELAVRSTAPIKLEFRDTPVKKVFELLAKLSGINFIFDGDVRDEKTTIDIKDATFKQALELILMTAKLQRKVLNENTIIIYPATPMKAVHYEETMIKVFYLTNSDAKKAVNFLKVMVRAKDMMVDEEHNAIIIRSKPDVIELARKILEVTDLADSEVMLEVSIMEINRNKASNLGIDLSPDSISASVPTTGGTIKLGDLRALASGDILINLPTAVLNIKKEDLDANILANPKIRVKNNNKARIHVGERVPITTTAVNQGIISESVQYLDVGLKFLVEPTIKKNDEIDIRLSLEVSSLGTKITTSSGSTIYQIGTRTTETVLSLRDGETQVFGGLISDEERTTTKKIPLLGDVPILGWLFSNVDHGKVKTEILLSITPRIIRKLDVPDEPSSAFLAGTDESPSAAPLFEDFYPEAREQQESQQSERQPFIQPVPSIPLSNEPSPSPQPAPIETPVQ